MIANDKMKNEYTQTASVGVGRKERIYSNFHLKVLWCLDYYLRVGGETIVYSRTRSRWRIIHSFLGKVKQ